MGSSSSQPNYSNLRTVLDFLPDYIYFKDTQSRFVDANKATLRIMKCKSLEDCIGKTDFNFYPKEFAEKYYSDEQEIFRTGEPLLDLEEVTPDENGNLGYYSTTKVPLKDESGKIIGLVGIGRDITERKRSQELEMRRQIDKIKHLSDLGTLVSTVAHELRNPICAMKFSILNLKKNKQIESKYLDDMENLLWQSNSIIDNLLSYSHIKSPIYQSCNLIDLIDECIALLPLSSSGHHIYIDKKYSSKELMTEVDPFQIKLVFTNLLNNACQAICHKDGRIEIDLELLANDRVCISFKDDGIGIDPENLSKIFTPFYTSKSSGTGLGLAICKELIHLHDGMIEANSRKGEWTVFRVTLPLKRPFGQN